MRHEIKNKRENKKNIDTIQEELKGLKDIKMAMTVKKKQLKKRDYYTS